MSLDLNIIELKKNVNIKSNEDIKEYHQLDKKNIQIIVLIK